MVTILILAQYGLIGQPEGPLNLSYLADTVVSVRFFESAGAVRQALSVIKKRSGRHEKTIREYQLVSDGGVRIGQPLKQFQGVLTGNPAFYGAIEQMMEPPDGAE